MSIKLYRKIQGESDSSYVLIDTVADGVETKSVTGLSPDTTYVFKGVRNIEGVDSTAVTTTGTTNSSSTPPPEDGSTVAEIAGLYYTNSGRTSGLTAFQTFANGLHTDGIYDKGIAFWMLDGSNETANKLNFFDPYDSNDAFRASFVGTTPNTTDGLFFPGSVGFMETYINYPNIAGSPSVGTGYYSKDLLTGSLVADYNGGAYSIYFHDTDGKAYPLINTDSGVVGQTVSGGNKAGYKFAQRNGNKFQTFNGTVKVTDETFAVGGNERESASDKTIKFHHAYNGIHGQDANVLCVWQFMALTEAENTMLKNRIDTLLTGLGHSLVA